MMSKFVTILLGFAYATSMAEGFAADFGVLKAGNESVGIVGGHEAQPHSHPHQITLQKWNGQQWQHFCGGSLVEAGKVVLAAHCIKDQDRRYFAVVGGAHSLKTRENTKQGSYIGSWQMHPYYGSDGGHDYDYAVIHLKDPFTLNENVNTIEMAPEGSEPTGECVTSGWGNTRRRRDNNPDKLQEATLPIVDHQECERKYANARIGQVTDRMFCAGADELGPCHGDSGGPLLCDYENGQRLLAGIVSWGRPRDCAKDGFPGVYANVAVGRRWLDEN